MNPYRSVKRRAAFFYCAALVSMILSGMAYAQSDVIGLVKNQMMPVIQVGAPGDTLTREYNYYRPAGLQGKTPLVIYFHGGSLDSNYAVSNGATSHRWIDLAEANKFLVIFPNGTNDQGQYLIGANKGKDKFNATGTNQHWNDCRIAMTNKTRANDLAFTKELVRWAENKAWTPPDPNDPTKNISIDPQRIYVTGDSNGGAMTHRNLIQQSDLVAAGAAFIADLPTDSNNACTSGPARAVPLFMLFGTNDKTMDYAGTCVAGQSPPAEGCLKSAQDTRDWWINQYGALSKSSSPSSCPAPANATVKTDANDSSITWCTYNDINTTDGPGSNSSVVSSYAYSGGNAAIVSYTVDGGGHLVPSVIYSDATAQALLGPQNRDLESVDEAWNFLKDKTCGTCQKLTP